MGLVTAEITLRIQGNQLFSLSELKPWLILGQVPFNG